MPWPLSQDYNEAIQTPVQCFSDAELKQGEAVCNALGLPIPCSGNFADVYAVQAGAKKWAVKCFTRQIPGLQERYVQISAYLQKVNLPFMVEFSFLQQGIRVRGEWYPVLKMQWVEGFNLNAFVRDNLDKPQTLQNLCLIWAKLAQRLHEANLAHCDLQHGNVLLVPSKAGALGVRLVDYDGMCVPALELLKTIELGHANYQHPQRLKEGTYGIHIDRFPHLVIYTALRALSVGGKALWDKFDNGDNLLFTQKDFAAPAQSPVFAELLKLNDPEARQLTQTLLQAAQKPIDQVPLLDSLVAVPKPQSKVTATLPQAVAAQTMPAQAAPENVFAGATGPVSSARHRRPARGKSSAGLVIGGAVAAAALIAGAVVFFKMSSSPDNSGAVAVIPKTTGVAPPVDTGRPPASQPIMRPTADSRPTVPPRTEPKIDTKDPEPKIDKKQPKDDPPAKEFAITALPEKLTLEPGGEAKVEVVFDPAGLPGRPKMVFSGGPPGVFLKTITGNDAMHKLTLTFAAQADAAEAAKAWRIHLLLGTPEQKTPTKEMLIAVVRPVKPVPKPKDDPPPVVVKKLEVPPEKKQEESRATILDLFKADYAKKAAKDRIELATKLFDTAAVTKNDPVGKFVLLSESATVAAAVGEVEKAMAALDALLAEYAVDGIVLKATALAKAATAPLSPAAYRSLAEAAFKTAEDAVTEDKLDATLSLLKVAETAARKAPQSAPLVKQVQELHKEIDAARQAEKVLKTKPDEAEALATLGKFLCFSKKDWAKGLTLLAASNDDALKSQAKADLANPAAAEEQIKVGDGWYDLGEAKTGSAKAALLARAAFWYEKALPSQTGLMAEKLTKRIAQADEAKQGGALTEVRKWAWTSRPTCVAFVPDGKHAIVGDADKTLSLIDLRSGKVLATQRVQNAVTCISCSLDGKYAVTLDGEHGVNVWETENLQLTKNSNQGFPTASVAFTYDNKVLCAHKGRLPCWIHNMIDAGFSTAVGFPKGTNTTCGTACLGGNLIAVGTEEGTVEAVLSLPKKPSAQVHLVGHAKEVVGVAVSKDGLWLLSGSADKTARLWDLVRGKEKLILRGHTEPLTAVALSLDARALVTGSEDKTIRVWSARSGKETRRFTGHTGAITGLSVSKDGQQALSTSADNTVRLWELFK